MSTIPAGYLHEDVVLMFCDVETTGLNPETDHVIELAVVFVTWPGLEELAAQEWLVEAPAECFEEDPKWARPADSEEKPDTFRWKAPYRGAARVHQLEPGDVHPEVGEGSWPESVAIELCDLIAQVKRGSRARKIVLTSDNCVFETAFIQKLLKAAGERWPLHYCSWDTSLLLEATGVGDPNNPPHRAMADTRALLGQMRAAMQVIREPMILVGE